MPTFSQRSISNLETCHPDLRSLFSEVIEHFDCAVIEGHRGREAQEAAYESGHSRARFGQSYHNATPALACDVVPYPIDWENLEHFQHFAGFVLGVASQMGIRVRWGGHFKSIMDMPHYELVDYSLEEFLR